MKAFILSFLFFFSLPSTSFYDFVVTSTEGNAIRFTDLHNKKILVVNIATNGPRVNQIGELQQLQQQYGDSLVIVAFPSNSFGNETRSDAEIKQFCQSQYGANFLLATKASVRGSNIQPLYNWLTHHSENQVLDSDVKGDFQKYLIDKNGNLVGVFSGAVSPLSKQIIFALSVIQNQ